VILFDTHIWIWWAERSGQMPAAVDAYIQAEGKNGIGVSAMSCWEVAKLVSQSRIHLSSPVDQWLAGSLTRIQLIPLTPEIAVESTRLPGTFHRDPSDQIIVATARYLDCLLVTVDRRIRAYPHVRVAP
jgi:PIN domain nuclease of toxin-antitoxin system